MGVFKDKLFLEVWKFLLKQRDKSSLLSGINAPREGRHGVRAAWKDICDNRPAEGLKTKTGMRDVLYDRPDLFNIFGPQQHASVQLTELALSVDPRDGLPAYASAEPEFEIGSTLPPVIPEGAGASFIDEPESGDDDDGGSGAATSSGGLMKPLQVGRVSSGGAGLDSDQMAALASFLGDGEDEPKAEPKVGIQTTIKKIGKEKREIELTAKNILPSAKWDFDFPALNARTGQYGDIVWTPQLGEEKRNAEKKEWTMVKAVFDVIQLYGGGPVQMTQACSHYKVQAVKKEPPFKTMKMVDFCKLYPQVIEILPEENGQGFLAKVVPGAKDHFPVDLDLGEEHGSEIMSNLPKFILNAETPHDKIQALRIEIIHSLANRGSNLLLTDIGHDPRVQQAKREVSALKKVTEFIRMFPKNFRLTEAPPMTVELISTDIEDTSAISEALKTKSFRDTPMMAEYQASQRASGPGRGGGSGPPQRLALGNAPAPRRSPVRINAPRRSPPRRSPPRGRREPSRRRREPSRGRRERSRSRRRRERSRSRSRRDRNRDRDRKPLAVLE
eukprot:TRINITY_DN10949_c0_g1_i1.p1 TRINITY_DN10949_c0_g1~~TRINITY_DN10949_c0_g1_i1.p1  ORF type:complete len:558 (-),score=88.63 TRINITY_DN10949_c0_g1_i1:134-1807(-)